MKKWRFLLCSFFLVILFTGCSNNSSESATENTTSQSADQAVPELEKKEQSESGSVENTVEKEKKEDSIDSDRMVIYTADLSIKVLNFDETVKFVQEKIETLHGYVVQSHSYSVDGGETVEGTITVRIPQESFHLFLESVEKGSTKILDRSISGQDVTEEFVDLESRLKSKQVVEKRLLEFMENAEKTEDLLKISSDLAAIQEEIETVKGRMNYLDNQVSLATVTLQVREDKVNVPGLDNEDLNTWERTKKQFMESVNVVLKSMSSIFIFLVGSLPILILIGGILFITLFIFKRKRKHNQGKPPTNLGE
ncbi:DUF4349 domain-containing protein [Metabacillus litoralis]|uniref:DUF4349 domain-containing protein n=1 Tax=Metabacillus litoralis TaxID=152268 RepID=UPI000EF5B5B0|nr:DUF4349 domain-containing protein [Metabacillus litoralis]MCM3408888.1 DUF4349 domain-containing protein [Metabacillus litoralis]